MSGSALEAFTDFVLTTGPSFLRGPEDIINEAVKNTYTLPRFWSGKSTKEILQGGSSIKDTIFFTEDSNYTHYHPNEEFTYRNPQVLSEWEIPWRFTKDEMVWTDQEVGLNTGDLSRGAKFHKFKTLKRSKEANLWTGFCNGFEDDLWAVPNESTMEDASGKVPYSIPSFVTESSTGIPFDADGDDWAGNEVQGIDVTAQSKWDNQRGTYAALNFTSASSATLSAFFSSFSNLYWQLRFDRLPKGAEYSEPTTSPNFIACSLKGIINFEAALRNTNDQLVAAGRQDPAYTAPMFRGVPLQYISNLDTATLYDIGSSLGTEGNTAGSNPVGPRYYFLNGKYLNMVIHSERYFYKKEPFSPSKQPFTKIMIVDCWHNLVCRSRQRQGLLSPAGDITNVDGTGGTAGY